MKVTIRVLVPHPASAIISSRKIYQIKVKFDRKLNQYKASLVAEDYKKEYVIDYKKTFVPIAKLTTVKTSLGIIVVHNWPL